MSSRTNRPEGKTPSLFRQKDDTVSQIKTLITVGTRPEIIKMAPVITELRARPDQFDVRILFTAQHRDMLDQMASFFAITSDIDLDLMRADQQLGELTARMLSRMHEVLQDEQPDMVLAQGDTTTVMVTALACFYLKLPFGHVEAGLRTIDKYNPFPEEINRRLVAQLADLHFAPTDRDRSALLAENVPVSSIHVTGNTVVDAVLDVAQRAIPLPPAVSAADELVLLTMHRRESFGEKLESVFDAIREIAARRPQANIVYPVHPNPNVRRTAHRMLADQKNIQLLDPVPYGEFVALMKHATLILTDSGGIQEEAPSLKVPVLVLRDVTERTQAVESGLARLVGTDRRAIVANALELLNDDAARSKMTDVPNPFGDGRAAQRIADVIAGFSAPEGGSTSVQRSTSEAVGRTSRA